MNMQNLLQVDLFLQVNGITPGRAAALVPAVLGLVSVVLGGVALARAVVKPVRISGISALVLALVCVILSVLHLARATGAIGTGSGRLGAIVALVLGITGMVLGAWALARSRRKENKS